MMASLQNQNRNQKPANSISHGPSLARLAAAAESRADALTARGNYSDALDTAIQAVELYMRARQEASTPSEKHHLDQKCSNILAKAERWKKRQEAEAGSIPAPASKHYAVAIASTPPPAGPPRKRPVPRAVKSLTLKEQTLLLKSGIINGNKFPPWEGRPTASEFPEEPFLDPVGFLQLSDSQKGILDDWKRPHEIYDDARIMPRDGEKADLTQDLVTDCSVVASLCAGSRREEKGLGRTVSNIIYPQDENGQAVVSPSGKYIVKLFFNGCYRKVIIDDYLPASRSGRALYVTCRNNPSVFGPALIEKAYLKIMGGYDFPGSNSGTDLLALTGWIPEHVFLQSDEVMLGTLWRRMTKAWAAGDVLITLGTGRMTVREEIELGLIGEHDYAVLEMKEDGEKLMLVKNPWSEGTVWKGIPTEEDDDDRDFDAPSDSESNGLDMSNLKQALPTKESLEPGVFWISFEGVYRNFASIYLNWNPTLFTHIHESHFSWDLSTKHTETSFGRNPQYSIENPSKTSGPVWILLSRHLGLPNTKSEGMIKNGFISLYLFDASGRRVYLSAPSLRRTPYVDSPQTLLCINDFPSGETYTIVVSSQDLSPKIHPFSLAIYSLADLRITPVIEPYPYSLSLSSTWTEATAGGNAHSSSYPQNPQFILSVSTATDIGLLLESQTEHPIHVKLVHSPGGRVASVTTRDIVAESGEYKRSTALATMSSLPAGSYTVVASTFEAGQVGDFDLTLLSTSSSATLKELPAETAGCFETVVRGTWESGRRKLIWPMDVGRLMGLWVKARSEGALKVYVLRGDGVAAQSGGGEFEDLPMGVRTARVDLGWREGGYYIVLERPGRESTGKWEVRVLSEGTLWVGEEENMEDVDE